MEKAIIFDASTLINFAMNGLFEEIRKLKSIFRGKFLITEQVKKEIIDHPLKVKRFQLEAIRIQELLYDKILEMPSSLGVNEKEVTEKTQRILKTANSLFIGDGKEIHLIDDGEASCLALKNILDKKGVESILAIDERTMRLLIEDPGNLKSLLERKLHVKIKIKKENLSSFKAKVIRSTELAYVLWKRRLIKLRDDVLGALLYSLKYNGASVSEDEINEIKKLG